MRRKGQIRRREKSEKSDSSKRHRSQLNHNKERLTDGVYRHLPSRPSSFFGHMVKEIENPDKHTKKRCT